MSRLSPRERVRVSGKGRTKTWDKERVGTVERVERSSVFVQWDNIAVVDEMEPRELVSLNEFAESLEESVGEMLATTDALNNLTRDAAAKQKA